MKKHTLIYYDESSYIPDEVFEGLSAMLPESAVTSWLPKRQNWFKRHEFALWFGFVVVVSFTTFYIFSHPQLLWDLTNPLVKLMGGKIQ